MAPTDRLSFAYTPTFVFSKNISSDGFHGNNTPLVFESKVKYRYHNNVCGTWWRCGYVYYGSPVHRTRIIYLNVTRTPPNGYSTICFCEENVFCQTYEHYRLTTPEPSIVTDENGRKPWKRRRLIRRYMENVKHFSNGKSTNLWIMTDTHLAETF